MNEDVAEPTPLNSVIRIPENVPMIDFQKFLSALGDILTQDVAECAYQKILELAISISPNAQAGSVLQLANDERYHFVAASDCYDLTSLQAVSFALEESILRASPEQQSFLFHDFDKFNTDNIDARHSQTLQMAGKVKDIKETLCVPIKKQGKIMAMLCLDNFDSSTAFSTDEVIVAELLGGILSVFIEQLKYQKRLEGLVSGLDALITNTELLPNKVSKEENFIQELSIPLTKRELQILECLEEGLENKQIAKQLGISPNTVSGTVTRVYNKLGVRNRIKAVAWLKAQR